MRRYRGELYDTADQLVVSIERHLRHMSSFSLWTIGTTDDAARRYDELGEPPFWRFWVAGAEEVARAALDHFAALKMKVDPGSRPGDVVYLY